MPEIRWLGRAQGVGRRLRFPIPNLRTGRIPNWENVRWRALDSTFDSSMMDWHTPPHAIFKSRTVLSSGPND